MEEILYETKSDLNFHEYKKFEHILENKTLVGDILVGLGSAALWSLGIYSIIRRNPILGGIAIAGGIAVIILYLVFMGLRSHGAWNKDTERKNLITTFKFYEDRVLASSSYKNYDIKYNQLYSVIETPSNFYLMVSKDEGLVVIKSRCEIGLVDKLHELSKIKEHI